MRMVIRHLLLILFVIVIILNGALNNYGNIVSQANVFYVPDNYRTISQAIDSVPPNSIIIVKPGTYRERVPIQINKPLKLVSLDPSATKIVLNGTGFSSIWIQSSNVLINGFTFNATGTNYILWVKNNNVNISNNIFIRSTETIGSIYVEGPVGNISIMNNIFTVEQLSNRCWYLSVDGVDVFNGYIVVKTVGQLYLYNNTIIHRETICGVEELRIGIIIYKVNMGEVKFNRIIGSKSLSTGIAIIDSISIVVLNNSIDSINIPKTKYLCHLGALCIYKGANMDIVNNSIGSITGYGISVLSSHDIAMRDNVIRDITDYDAIYLNSSSGSIIEHNYVYRTSGYGVSLLRSNNNYIYLNNFLSCEKECLYIDKESLYNTFHTKDKVKYLFMDKVFSNYLGNYWGDYLGMDRDGDGIGDMPYRDLDPYPMINTLDNYIVAPPGSEIILYTVTETKTIREEITRTSMVTETKSSISTIYITSREVVTRTIPTANTITITSYIYAITTHERISTSIVTTYTTSYKTLYNISTIYRTTYATSLVEVEGIGIQYIIIVAIICIIIGIGIGIAIKSILSRKIEEHKEIG